MNAGAALWVAIVAAEGAALWLCLKIHVRRSEPRATTPLEPLAYLLFFALVTDVLTAAGQCAVLRGPRTVIPFAAEICAAVPATRPFAGAARLLYHAETVCVLGWPVALCLSVWRAFVFPGRAALPYAVLGSWIGVSVGMAALYPLSRSATQWLVTLIEVIAVAVAWIAVWLGWGRPWSRVTATSCLVLMLVFETVVLTLGPFSHDLFRDWPLLARVPYALSFGSVVLLLFASARRFEP